MDKQMLYKVYSGQVLRTHTKTAFATQPRTRSLIFLILIFNFTKLYFYYYLLLTVRFGQKIFTFINFQVNCSFEQNK